MTFALDTHWVWDFWIADDGVDYHLFYLHAPKSLGDETLRHRNARVGHAVSRDLVGWIDGGEVLGPGAAGDPDQTATWTGSVVRGPDGIWSMFYTGSRFLREDATTNIETVCVARSTDLHVWEKVPARSLSVDPQWYETLADGTWREEAWRDPWVFPDPDGSGWHMLLTARARDFDGPDRGVVGHATSADLVSWTAGPPVTRPGAGFAHLEVPQVVAVEDRLVLVFSCDSAALAGARAGQAGGIWAVEVGSAVGPFDLTDVRLLLPEHLYAGRIVERRDGPPVLMGFVNGTGDGFGGTISDPLPLGWDPGSGSLEVGTAGVG